jgi:RNA polymerase sigma-70 factor (ECF subfamily)
MAPPRDRVPLGVEVAVLDDMSRGLSSDDAAARRDASGNPQDDARRHSAFATYVQPQIEVLYRVALTLTHHPADAEDLVQDTLIRAFRAADRFDGRHPRAWLLTILRRTHLNRVRQRTPSLLADGSEAGRTLEELGPSLPSSEEIALSGEFEPVVAQALGDLPTEFRAVVDLVDLQGLSYAQAAEALGVPKGTVMSRLHRARRRIRERLMDVGLARGAEGT